MKHGVLVRIKEIYLPDDNIAGSPDFTGAQPGGNEPDFTGGDDFTGADGGAAKKEDPPPEDDYDFR